MKLSEKLRASMPPSIKMPEELGWLADWYEDAKKQINGHFRVCVHDPDDLRAWFGRDTPKIEKLAVFGRSSDGSMFAIWDTGKAFPIVHLGSEGDSIKLLANDANEFLRLLAVGYDPLGHADESVPPDAHAPVTIEFRRWVEDQLHLVVPKIGSEIVQPAHKSNMDFEKWLEL